MRRRTFIRTVTSGVSAVVFTSAGWLMGTRSLTMTTPPDPPPPCTRWCSGTIGVCQYSSNCQGPPYTSTYCNTVNKGYYSYTDCNSINCSITDVTGICQCNPCVTPSEDHTDAGEVPSSYPSRRDRSPSRDAFTREVRLSIAQGMAHSSNRSDLMWRGASSRVSR
jgi:hypothetical protein